jgi:hypothetical protein
MIDGGVFRRYWRWVEMGVFDALLETLSEMVERDGSADMMDSTVVWAHHCAVGLKRGIRSTRASAARAVVLLVVVGWGCGAKGHKGHAYSCVRAGARARTRAQPWAGGMIGDGRRERASAKAKGNGACRL